MKISYELEQGYIDVWNEESEEWDRYIKVNKESVVEEKKIPEKLEDFNLTTYSRNDEDLGLELHYTGVSNTFNNVYLKINEIIDFLKQN